MRLHVARIAVVGALLFMPLGCAGTYYKAYDGPTRSPDELAYILTTYEDHPELPDGVQPVFTVDSVDERGSKLGGGPRCLVVLPGPHTLEVSCQLNRGMQWSWSEPPGWNFEPVLVPCTLAAGRVYRFVGKVVLFDRKAGRLTFENNVEDVTDTHGRDGRPLRATAAK